MNNHQTWFNGYRFGFNSSRTLAVVKIFYNQQRVWPKLRRKISRVAQKLAHTLSGIK